MASVAAKGEAIDELAWRLLHALPLGLMLPLSQSVTFFLVQVLFRATVGAPDVPQGRPTHSGLILMRPGVRPPRVNR